MSVCVPTQRPDRLLPRTGVLVPWLPALLEVLLVLTQIQPPATRFAPPFGPRPTRPPTATAPAACVATTWGAVWPECKTRRVTGVIWMPSSHPREWKAAFDAQISDPHVLTVLRTTLEAAEVCTRTLSYFCVYTLLSGSVVSLDRFAGRRSRRRRPGRCADGDGGGGARERFTAAVSPPSRYRHHLTLDRTP